MIHKNKKKKKKKETRNPRERERTKEERYPISDSTFVRENTILPDKVGSAGAEFKKKESEILGENKGKQYTGLGGVGEVDTWPCRAGKGRTKENENLYFCGVAAGGGVRLEGGQKLQSSKSRSAEFVFTVRKYVLIFLFC